MSRTWVLTLAGLAAASGPWTPWLAAQESAPEREPPAVETSVTLDSRTDASFLFNDGGPAPGLIGGENRTWALETGEELSLKIELFHSVQIVQRLAVTTSNRDNDGAFDSVIRPGVLESYVAFISRTGAKISAGVIMPSFGNSLFLNPMDWLARYIPDPLVPGASSFLGVEARFSIGEWTFGMTAIPALPDTGLGLFNQSIENHFGALTASGLLWGSSVALDAFGEAKPDFSGFYWGTGLETQTPIADFASVDAQLLVSNGKKAFALTQGQYSLLLSQRDGSEEEFYLDAAVYGELTIASFSNVGIGYAYSGRGLAAESLIRLRTDGYEPVREAGLTTLLLAYAAPFLWPPSFLDHVLFCSFSIPRITESFGAVLTVFASPLDPSAWTRLVLSWNPLESAQIDLSLEGALGAVGSLFNPFRQEWTATVSCVFSL